MIGRQVRVRVVKSDRALLEQEVRRRNGVLLPYATDSADLGMAHSIEVPDGSAPPWFARASDKELLHRYFVEAQGYWLIDRALAPIVQWTKVSPEREGVADFSLYFAPEDVRAGAWVSQPPEFVEWADGILRWVRGTFIRLQDEAVYVGPGADAHIGSEPST
jgi:hypothetical protein